MKKRESASAVVETDQQRKMRAQQDDKSNKPLLNMLYVQIMRGYI